MLERREPNAAISFPLKTTSFSQKSVGYLSPPPPAPYHILDQTWTSALPTVSTSPTTRSALPTSRSRPATVKA